MSSYRTRTTSSVSRDRYDLVVVGAGIFGLAVAKTWIQLHPKSTILILESASSLGGTWAEHRLYPGLKSNNLLGMYEYPDYPMDSLAARTGIKPGDHIPAAVMHQYLVDYAKHFDVYDRIRFNCKVESVEKQRFGWQLTVDDSSTDAVALGEQTILTSKLVVATGLTSEPNMPQTDVNDFKPLMIHTRDLLQCNDKLKAAKSVVVLGGNKSAWDAAYELVTPSDDVTAHMVIRKSGSGPCWMAPTHVTPLKQWLEKLVCTRFLSWLSPCIWADWPSPIRRFLHGTSVGRAIVNGFWHVLGSDLFELNQYDKHPETAKLKPWGKPSDALFVGTNLSILNYPTDFFELVRSGRIKVHIEDLDHLSGDSVHLSNGEMLEADAFICATGWKSRPTIQWDSEVENRLGLPYSYGNALSRPLTRYAREEVFRRFPRLKDQPEHSQVIEEEEQKEPWRLYRFLVPPALIPDRNIAFAGMIGTLPTALAAHAQALWLTAYLDGTLQLKTPTVPQQLTQDGKPVDPFEWETALHTEFCKLRYPKGYGVHNPDFVFDSVPYIDLLLKDLGIKTRRKNGFLKELFEGYGPRDYQGVVEEWTGKVERMEKERKKEQ